MFEKHILAPTDDITIARDDPDYPGMVAVFDDEGEHVWTFLGEWSDDQIKMAIDLANHAYATGYRLGGDNKAREIRLAIGAQEAES